MITQTRPYRRRQIYDRKFDGFGQGSGQLSGVFATGSKRPQADVDVGLRTVVIACMNADALDNCAHDVSVHDFAAARYDRNQVEPVLALEIQVAAYLTQLKDGRGVRLSNISELTGWETEYEHWLSSLVRTGRHFSASRQSSTEGAFSGLVNASLALNAYVAISVDAQPPPL